MLLECVLSPLTTDEEPRADWLDLTWFDCTQRVLRKRTRSGELLRILLPVGVSLRQGDVLVRSAERVVAVHQIVSEVLVARPMDGGALARLALDLGNLHLPVQVAGSSLIVLDDGPTRAALERHGVEFVTESRRFEPERCSVSAVVSAGDRGRGRE